MEVDNLEVSLSSFLIAMLIIAGVAVAAYAALTFVLRVPSAGTIKTIGVQIRDAYGNVIPRIYWGTVTPGSTITYNAHIYNNGSTPVTLQLSVADWNPPAAASHLSLTWNYTGGAINPKQSIPVAFSLTVSPQASGIENFSFLIVITAQEAV